MPEVTTSSENAESEVRQRTLEALAISLGANETTAKLSAYALLAKADAVSHLPFDVNRDQLEPEQVQEIEAIGAWFLTGSSRSYLKFTVGCRALSLLRESPDSSYFTYLEETVGRWTDGTRNNVFKKLVERK